VDPTVYAVPPQTRARVRAELGLSDEDRLLLFSGSRFEPNLDALRVLREFCRTEAEFLARERVHILVMGSVCEAPLREGALIATGRVPDSLPFFAAADAGLNPMTLGSGANVKLQPDVDFVQLEITDLKPAIQAFVRTRNREQWRAHAEAVWARHRADCDIQMLVAAAVAQLPEFDPREFMTAAESSSASGYAADPHESASAPAARTAGRSSKIQTG
jgi:hypothetical protein